MQGQLGLGERCINGDNVGVKLVFCMLGTVHGPWQYDQVIYLSIFLIIFLFIIFSSMFKN